MFERASQVNARFAAGACQPGEVVAALRDLGLTESQISVLEPTPPIAPASVASPGVLARLRVFLGGTPASPPAPAPPDVQFMIHMGQDDALAGPVQDLFRRFGAAGIEHFAPTNTPQRHFGPPTAAPEAVPATATAGLAPTPAPASTTTTGEARWDDDGGASAEHNGQRPWA